MSVFLDLLVSTLTQGLIYAQLSYGIYITYKILDFRIFRWTAASPWARR